ncbi:MAG: M15 family metallopeptidase [Lachnospiraceae bacterium]|nr:M15 family metallopeptidase [Lachnospiraceae bacterium]
MHTFQILVNREHPLPSGYRPAQLVRVRIPFHAAPNDPKRQMEEPAALAAERLFAAARRRRLCLVGVSGYRSYIRQFTLYRENGASGETAPAGASEHQTGLALDVSCPSLHGELGTAFAATPEGRWLARHAPFYGFILRYPKGSEAVTGYPWEPWHIRYVGVPLALRLWIRGLTLEEYYNRRG